MSNAHDPIKNIQSRIDELEQTIADRGEQIKERTRQLKEDLQEELSPVEMLRRHPLEATGVSFVTGIVAGRVIRSLVSPKRQPATVAPQIQPAPQTYQAKPASPIAVAVSAIGAELLHAAKDMAVAWLKSQVESKKRKA
ncbi:MAG: hypothetical protein HGB16_03015 [Chlorobaculum sp.]|nr:hypothetical protein [Chlorobaculum sp.]